MSKLNELNCFFKKCMHIENEGNAGITNRKLPFEGILFSDCVVNEPILVAVDFDNTITTTDSTGMLFNHSMMASGSALQTGDVLYDTCQLLCKEYIKGIQKCVQATIESKDHVSVQSFIKRVSEFECQIQRKVEKNELLKGIPFHSLNRSEVPRASDDRSTDAEYSLLSLYDLGKTVQLKPYALDVLNFARGLFSRRGVNVDVSVVSLNWSATFIRGALHEPPVPPLIETVHGTAIDEGDNAIVNPFLHCSDPVNGVRPLHIYASELETVSTTQGHFLTTGNIISHKVMCNSFGPDQKRHVLNHIMSSMGLSSISQFCCGSTPAEDSPGQPEPFSVFIGDSIGDIAGLMDADLAIVIGDNETLRQVVEALDGVNMVPLHSLLVQGAFGDIRDIKSNSKHLYTCNTWLEIGYALFGDGFLTELGSS